MITMQRVQGAEGPEGRGQGLWGSRQITESLTGHVKPCCFTGTLETPDPGTPIL